MWTWTPRATALQATWPLHAGLCAEHVLAPGRCGGRAQSLPSVRLHQMGCTDAGGTRTAGLPKTREHPWWRRGTKGHWHHGQEAGSTRSQPARERPDRGQLPALRPTRGKQGPIIVYHKRIMLTADMLDIILIRKRGLSSQGYQSFCDSKLPHLEIWAWNLSSPLVWFLQCFGETKGEFLQVEASVHHLEKREVSFTGAQLAKGTDHRHLGNPQS